MARSWRSAARDPWASTDLVDALRAVRAIRHERAGNVRPGVLAETSEELRDRLGFGSIDELEQWAETVRERHRQRSEARQQEQSAARFDVTLWQVD